MFGEKALFGCIPKIVWGIWMYVYVHIQLLLNIQCCFNIWMADRFLFVILFGSGKQTSCNMQILINIGEWMPLFCYTTFWIMNWIFLYKKNQFFPILYFCFSILYAPPKRINVLPLKLFCIHTVYVYLQFSWFLPFCKYHSYIRCEEGKKILWALGHFFFVQWRYIHIGVVKLQF